MLCARKGISDRPPGNLPMAQDSRLSARCGRKKPSLRHRRFREIQNVIHDAKQISRRILQVFRIFQRFGFLAFPQDHLSHAHDNVDVINADGHSLPRRIPNNSEAIRFGDVGGKTISSSRSFSSLVAMHYFSPLYPRPKKFAKTQFRTLYMQNQKVYIGKGLTKSGEPPIYHIERRKAA